MTPSVILNSDRSLWVDHEDRPCHLRGVFVFIQMELDVKKDPRIPGFLPVTFKSKGGEAVL